jgi:hypothetical protein
LSQTDHPIIDWNHPSKRATGDGVAQISWASGASNQTAPKKLTAFVIVFLMGTFPEQIKPSAY